MIGRVLFLSAAAYAGYWYIRRSNRKAQQIVQGDTQVEILPPEETAVERARQARATPPVSRAAEPDPGR